MDGLIDIEILNEQDNSKRTIKFTRFGTYYELAEKIESEGIEIPEYFDLIITNGDKLKPSETEKIDFIDKRKIKIRDVTENESTIDFKNIECGKVVNLQVKNLGEKWRKITRGINLFGKCENEKCEAYNCEVIQMIKDLEFDATKNNGTLECPMCGCKSKLSNIGFYNCYYNFSGTKYDEEKEEIKKFGIYIPYFSDSVISDDNKVKVNDKYYKVFKTQIGKLSYFDENSDTVQFIRLIFQVKNFEKVRKMR